MYLTKLASSASPTSQQSGAAPKLSKETAVALAQALVTTITATRDAEAASIGASAKANEARAAYEVAKEGLAECLRLVERSFV